MLLRHKNSKKVMGGGGFRHEFKYVINSFQLALLQERLPQIMQEDLHTSPDGMYEVRSLYLDDYSNSCYFDNENGTDTRVKYRIRIYNGSPERIQFESKRKEHGMTLKTSCRMSVDQVKSILEGEHLEYQDQMHPLLKKLFILQETRGFKPKVIVEYDRIPFVCRDGNVRITLDTNIRSSVDFHSFLDFSVKARPIMPVGLNLLEVKYDSFIPDYIKETIQMDGLRQSSFSKYYLCRKIGGLQYEF